MKEKEYTVAIKLLETSLDWPEHLGVGRPYDPETRPQHYLLAHCYQQQGKTKLAQRHQDEVVAVTEQQTERSPYDLLGVLMLRQKRKSDEATRLLTKMKNSSDDPLMQWAVAYASDPKAAQASDELLSQDAYQSLQEMLRITE